MKIAVILGTRPEIIKMDSISFSFIDELASKLKIVFQNLVIWIITRV